MFATNGFPFNDDPLGRFAGVMERIVSNIGFDILENALRIASFEVTGRCIKPFHKTFNPKETSPKTPLAHHNPQRTSFPYSSFPSTQSMLLPWDCVSSQNGPN
ncbi:hypothetical protein CDAR_613421 [Caerostris darwini]|uniref:Uncharacterized protein n=1 Tax=Caerostris darwini TaxID=1538125 RepID=A0AAV4UMC8_9ARAC|nr:hypothetical protein CDAR_613421 [Caerostris darwini]